MLMYSVVQTHSTLYLVKLLKFSYNFHLRGEMVIVVVHPKIEALHPARLCEEVLEAAVGRAGPVPAVQLVHPHSPVSLQEIVIR